MANLKPRDKDLVGHITNQDRRISKLERRSQVYASAINSEVLPTGGAGGDLTGTYPNPLVSSVIKDDLMTHFGTIDWYGHSLTAFNNSGSYGIGDRNQAISQRVAASLGADVIDRTAPGGHAALHDGAASGAHFGGWASVYRYNTNSVDANLFEPRKALAVVYYGINDLAKLGPSNMGPLTRSLQAIYSRLNAVGIYEDTHASVAYSTGWSDNSVTPSSTYYASGNSYKTCTTSSSRHFTITVPSDFPGGTVAISFLTNPSGHGGSFDFTVDSVASGSLDARNAQSKDHTTGLNGAWTPSVKRITGLSAGSHTIVVTVTNVNTIAIFDCWWIESQVAPLIISPLMHRCNDYSAYAGGPYTPTDSTVTTELNNAIIAASSGFTNVVNVATDDIVNKQASYLSDGLHLSAKAMGYIADRIQEEIQQNPVSRLNKSRGNFSPPFLTQNPSSNNRNVIEPVSGVITPLTIKGAIVGDQTANLQEWKSGDTSSLVSSINKDGKFYAKDGIKTESDGYSHAVAQYNSITDTYPNFAVNSVGQILMGAGGGSSTDITLYRRVASVLATTGTLESESTSQGFKSKVGLLGYGYSQWGAFTDTFPEFNVGKYGVLSWGAGGASSPDAFLSRGAASTLVTETLESNSASAGFKTKVTGFGRGYSQWGSFSDTYPKFQIGPSGELSWGAGGSNAVDAFLSRSGASTLLIESMESSITTTNAYKAKVTGFGRAFSQWGSYTDTYPKFQIGPSGELSWGAGGSNAVDAFLSRSGASTLVTETLESNSASAGFKTKVTGFGRGYSQWGSFSDTYPKFQIGPSGELSWGAGGSNAVDAFLSRSGASTLLIESMESSITTTNAYKAKVTGFGRAFSQWGSYTDTYPKFSIGDLGIMLWGPGGSTAPDTSVYRSAANQLTTSPLVITGTATLPQQVTYGDSLKSTWTWHAECFDDNNWKNICDISIPNSAYQGVQIRVEYFNAATNFGYIVSPDNFVFVATATRAAAAANDTDSGKVIGPTDDHVRLVRISQGVYQLHARMPIDYNDFEIRAHVTSFNQDTPPTITWNNSPSDGSTGTHQYYGGWVPLPFENNWTNYGGGYEPCGYLRTLDGWIHLKGLLSGASKTAATIFTLPEKHRPAYTQLFDCTNSFNNGRIDINNNGTVVWVGGLGAVGYVPLNGIKFRIAY